MDLNLTGKGFLITGGSAGLGRALAKTLLAEGAKVAICARDEGRLTEAAQSLVAESGGEVLAMPADVRKPEDIQAVVDMVDHHWGELHGLVSNAGVHTGGKFLEIDDELWQSDFELKLLAIARLVRTAAPLLRKADGAAVLNVLSIYARFQPIHSMPSSVFRSAGLAMTNAMSKELAADGIRANAALIGFVDSDQWVRGAKAAGQSLEEFEDQMAKRMNIPLGRAGRSEEFADVAAFLLSDRASYITGTAVNVDGGQSVVA